MLVKYGVKTKIINFFKEFRDYRKRLFVLLTSSGIIHPVIYCFKKTKSKKYQISSNTKMQNLLENIYDKRIHLFLLKCFTHLMKTIVTTTGLQITTNFFLIFSQMLLHVFRYHLYRNYHCYFVYQLSIFFVSSISISVILTLLFFQDIITKKY